VGSLDGRLWWRLTDRDRLLLAVLAEHHVLTTDHIVTLAFGSARRAQDRLARLVEWGVLWRFRFGLAAGGTSPSHYTLGYTGARLIAAQRSVEPPRPAAWRQRVERLAESPQLRHRLGTNGVFVALAGYAAPTPTRSPGRTVRAG
jgi:Replication-relaxation